MVQSFASFQHCMFSVAFQSTYQILIIVIVITITITIIIIIITIIIIMIIVCYYHQIYLELS